MTFQVPDTKTFHFNDAGQEAAGVKWVNDNEQIRTAAILLDLPYRQVRKEMKDFYKAAKDKGLNTRKLVQHLMPASTFNSYLKSKGCQWVPTQTPSGKSTLRFGVDELPLGRIIIKLPSSLTAAVDAVVQDVTDWIAFYQQGRAVYGYWFNKPYADDLALALAWYTSKQDA